MKAPAFDKTPAMRSWERLSGSEIESIFRRWGDDLSSPKALAKALSEKGPRVTEGTAYLWIKRWEHWLSIQRYFEGSASNGV